VKSALGADFAVDNRIVVVAPPAPAEPAPAPTPVAETVTCETIARGVKIGFETGSALLDATGRRALDDVISCLTNDSYEITGHTDNVGAIRFNEVLSLRRAESVVRYLKTRGVTKSLQPKGAGPSQPVATNGTPEGRAQNRRIDFRPL
jgi:OmpA-OmpF porin, OOP family